MCENLSCVQLRQTHIRFDKIRSRFLNVVFIQYNTIYNVLMIAHQVTYVISSVNAPKHMITQHVTEVS